MDVATAASQFHAVANDRDVTLIVPANDVREMPKERESLYPTLR